MNNISAIGLFLDIIGAILLFVASDRLSNSITELVEESSKTIGFWQDNPLDENLFIRLNKSRKISSTLNKFGLAILVVGFLCQLIAVIFSVK
jgi:uncharacterized membrane protein